MILLARLKLLFIFLVTLFFLNGCATEPYLEVKKEKLSILSTTIMIGDIVSYIGGDKIESNVLISRELDPHSYEFVKGDDEKLLDADLIFYNGLGLEHGGSVRRFLKKSLNSYALGDELSTRNPALLIYLDNVPDPHIWMDVSIWQKVAELITEILIKKDPLHSAYFLERSVDLQKKYAQLHQVVHKKITEIPLKKRYLVTSHDAFNYFARAYFGSDWQKRVLAPEGLAPDGQISLQGLRLIINQMKEHNIQVVFPEAYVSPDPLRKIQESAEFEGLVVKISRDSLYSDSLPEGGDYQGMILYNAGVIHDNLAR